MCRKFANKSPAFLNEFASHKKRASDKHNLVCVRSIFGKQMQKIALLFWKLNIQRFNI